MTKNILIVEESKNIVFMMELYLQKNGFNVNYAYNGVEAVAKLFNNRPNLILIDIFIPKLNGPAICEMIKKNKDLRDIPIIAMTAKTQDKDINEGYQMGVSDYLTKPFTSKELLDTVKKNIS